MVEVETQKNQKSKMQLNNFAAKKLKKKKKKTKKLLKNWLEEQEMETKEGVHQ